jgi:putative acetyltransferase
MVRVRVETPLQDDIRAMIVALNDFLTPLAPKQFQFQMSAEEMAAEDTVVFVARDDDENAIGMGALKVHSATLGEVKRMFCEPKIRGTSAGRVILGAVEKMARTKGLEHLVLETGATKGFELAWRIYERCGYTQCGAVLDYPQSGYSRFYEKKPN